MAVLVALAYAVVLMLSGIIPVFGRSTTVDRTQTPVLQRIAKLNQFTAATGTFQVIVDIEDDVGGLPSILAGERTLMVASGEVEAEVDFTGLKSDAIVVDDADGSVVVTIPPPTPAGRRPGAVRRGREPDGGCSRCQRPVRPRPTQHRGHVGGDVGLGRLRRRDRRV